MSDVVIRVEDVKVCFPMVRYRAKSVKEAFYALIGRGPKATAKEKNFWALKGVSFDVERGEVLGLLGRNGSGKSTLLRVIAGIYAPDNGHVETKGRISSLLELGAGFRDELSGRENIKLAGAITGFSPAQVEAMTPGIIDFSELEEFIDQPLKTYSSGMRSRLGFAVASAVNPEILLIDEALAVGDASFREKSMSRIEEMVAGDTTVIIVSHSLGELERLCTKMVLLNRGEKICEGGPKEVLERYQELVRV